MIRIFYQLLSEISLIFLYPILSVIVWFVPRHELKGHGSGPNIILVERWLSVNIRHLYWKYYLERKGYNVYLANFPIRKGNFDKSAHQLAKYIERHELKGITLVGISSGALTALLYLQECNGWDRVDKFVAVGAPFKGTWMALFLAFAYSGRELLPNSGLVKKISTMNIINAHKIYCIKAKFDEMVPFGSFLPRTHHIMVDILGHNNLHIRVRATYKKIMEIA